MKTAKAIIMSTLCLTLCALPALNAQEGAKGREGRGRPGAGGLRPEPGQLRELFQNADADANLNIDEQEANALADKLIATAKERLAAGRKIADRDGDGTLNADELAAAKAHREKRQEEFQKNAGERLGRGPQAGAPEGAPGKGREGAPGRGRGPQGGEGPLPQFDADNDLELSAAEEQAMREHILGRVKERNQHIMELADTNKDGVLDEAETAKAKEMRQKMQERMQQRQKERQGGPAGRDGEGRGGKRQGRGGNPPATAAPAELPK